LVKILEIIPDFVSMFLQWILILLLSLLVDTELHLLNLLLGLIFFLLVFFQLLTKCQLDLLVEHLCSLTELFILFLLNSYQLLLYLFFKLLFSCLILSLLLPCCLFLQLDGRLFHCLVVLLLYLHNLNLMLKNFFLVLSFKLCCMIFQLFGVFFLDLFEGSLFAQKKFFQCFFTLFLK